MARFNYGGLVTNGTGRFNSALGGMVLMKNGVVRSYATPANPQTADQQAVRAQFASNTGAWNGLTDSQRQAWDAAAATGTWTKTDPFTGTTRAISSGKLLYMFVNQNLNIVGSANVSRPPAQAALGSSVVGVLTAAATAGTISCTYTGALGGGEKHIVSAAAAVNPGNMKMRKALQRFLDVYGGASPMNLAAAYTAKFGAITALAGQKIFIVVEAIDANTGQRRLVGTTFDIIAA